MKFKVKAIKLGYVNHKRQRVGTIFFLNEKNMIPKKAYTAKDKPRVVKGDNGVEYVLPSWVELADAAGKVDESSAKAMAASLPPSSSSTQDDQADDGDLDSEDEEKNVI